MNTNPNAKRILCFGDSITYGRIPGWARRAITRRFTWITQQILWDSYEIIEEWLRWRTLYWENKFFPWREWNLHFGPIVGSHLPLDLITVMLGTNDSNSKNDILTEDQVHDYLDDYIQQIDWRCKSIWSDTPRLLLVSPPNIMEEYGWEIFQHANHKIKAIQLAYSTYSKQNNIPFLETHNIIQASIVDWVHLDEENNKLLWEKLAEKIREIL